MKKKLMVLTYTQMWEFFSTYGMTALLVIYMSRVFLLSDARSYQLFGVYMTLLYISPMVGGAISDRFITKEFGVLWGGLLMAIGHAIIMIPSLHCLYIALVFMIAGYAFFTPCLIALVGRAHDAKSSHETDAGFTLWYVLQNIGAFLAPILCSYVGVKFGWNYAFGIAGLGMLTGIAVFIRKQCTLKELALKRAWLVILITLVCVPALYFLMHLHYLDEFVIAAACISLIFLFRLMFSLGQKERSQLIAIAVMLLFTILFFTFLSQGGTSLSLFFNRLVDRKIAGFTIPSPVLLSLDPLFMFILTPFVLRFFKKMGPQLSSSRKFSCSLFFMCLAFLVFSLAGKHAELSGAGASMGYVVLGFMLFPLGELFSMPVGYSLLTRLSPKSRVGFVVGVWTLGLAVARFSASKMAELANVPVKDRVNIRFEGAVYSHLFFIIATLAFMSAVLMLLVSPMVEQMMQGERVFKRHRNLSEERV